jgi:hypothetical protein
MLRSTALSPSGLFHHVALVRIGFTPFCSQIRSHHSKRTFSYVGVSVQASVSLPECTNPDWSASACEVIITNRDIHAVQPRQGQRLFEDFDGRSLVRTSRY